METQHRMLVSFGVLYNTRQDKKKQNFCKHQTKSKQLKTKQNKKIENEN